MSNYPDDLPTARMTIVLLKCPKCECEWEAEAINDLGETRIYNDMDEVCPDCGKEGVYVD